MTQKERLVELLKGCPANYLFMYEGDFDLFESLADHLLSNGVIVPPCKVGDLLYYPGDVLPQMVRSFYCSDDDLTVGTDSEEYWEDEIGESVFLTREEAEQALKEREKE